MVCDVYGDQVAPQALGVYGIGTSTQCPGNYDPGSYTASDPPGGMAIWTGSSNTVQQGTAVHWSVAAPAGLMIASVYIPHMYSQGIDDGSGWGGGFFWQGGSGGVSTFDGESGWSSSYTGPPSYTWPAGGTPYFGWQVVCGASPCSNGGSQWLSIELLELHVTETAGPTLVSPDGLWQSSGWIRGTWTLHYGGDSPSGLCQLSGSLNGRALPGSSSARDSAVWHQCAAPTVDAPVDTSQYGNGPETLTLSTVDGADWPAQVSKTVYVDNQAPTVSLSGPQDAPTTAGTQYVTATATAGPSGVAGISCTVDGGPPTWYAASSAQVPVQGLGVHHVTCSSENNARDTTGTDAVSPPTTWTLSIREPAFSTVSFERAVDALHCARARERVRIPAHWVTAYSHGHAVKVRLPAQTRTVKVTRCHPHVIVRRIRVDGHWRTQRIAELPHESLFSWRRVLPGHSTVLSGWLGTSDGDALGGQTVTILTAPADGSSRFTRAATATTRSNGTWNARLGPGPSRIVLAVYGGSSAVEPAWSSPIHLIVPATIRLAIRPRLSRWGGRIEISGRVLGGYVPAAGELLVIRVGWPGGSAEVGHLYTRPDGRFFSRYTFLRGNGVERYRFWATTARESDYPYAPGRSRAIAVAVR